jgi:hypothetical protein
MMTAGLTSVTGGWRLSRGSPWQRCRPAARARREQPVITHWPAVTAADLSFHRGKRDARNGVRTPPVAPRGPAVYTIAAPLCRPGSVLTWVRTMIRVT